MLCYVTLPTKRAICLITIVGNVWFTCYNAEAVQHATLGEDIITMSTDLLKYTHITHTKPITAQNVCLQNISDNTLCLYWLPNPRCHVSNEPSHCSGLTDGVWLQNHCNRQTDRQTQTDSATSATFTVCRSSLLLMTRHDVNVSKFDTER